MKIFAHIDSVSPVQHFEVKSGALRVTDPCYDLETWCAGAGTVENVLSGRFAAHVGYYKCPTDTASAEHWLEEAKKEYEEILAQHKASGLTDEVAKSYASYQQREIERHEKRIRNYSGRVAYIHIVHVDHEADPVDLAKYVRNEPIHVGVDSGQAGFFDLVSYPSTSRRDAGKGEEFYMRVCDLTLDSGGQWGVLEFGCVSLTGYGDGGYSLFERRNDAGQLIAAYIEFIGADDGEEELDDEAEDVQAA